MAKVMIYSYRPRKVCQQKSGRMQRKTPFPEFKIQITLIKIPGIEME
jgi:hypothetical protein